MPRLDPGIHVFGQRAYISSSAAWMAGSSPAMTMKRRA